MSRKNDFGETVVCDNYYKQWPFAPMEIHVHEFKNSKFQIRLELNLKFIMLIVPIPMQYKLILVFLLWYLIAAQFNYSTKKFIKNLQCRPATKWEWITRTGFSVATLWIIQIQFAYTGWRWKMMEIRHARGCYILPSICSRSDWRIKT